MQFNRSDKIPQELLDLEGRQFVFTIQGSDSTKFSRPSIFRVYELTDKPEIVQKFQENLLQMVNSVCLWRFSYIRFSWYQH